MKFLVDAQLPRGICVGLTRLGHDGLFVDDALGRGASDNRITDFAVAESRVLITKDGDFLTDRRVGLRIVWLRIGNVSNANLIPWLNRRWNAVEQALERGEMSIEVR